MIRQYLFINSILGLLVSGYLFIAYATGAPIVCGSGHGCDIVRASQFANFFGLPTPLYGLVFYLFLSVGALFATKQNHYWIKWPLLLLTAAGLAVSVGLTYIEAFVIIAWCAWCVVSAVLTVAAALLALRFFMKPID